MKKKIKYFHKFDTFHGVMLKERLERNMGYDDDILFIKNGEGKHAIKSIIYMPGIEGVRGSKTENLVYDVSWEIHKVGECGWCEERKDLPITKIWSEPKIKDLQ